MEIFQKFALTLAIVMLGLWGIGLILFPEFITSLLIESGEHASGGLSDGVRTLAGMMGAALLGLALISFASVTQWMNAGRALGIAVLLLVVESAYLMLGAGTMLVTAPTAMSLVAAAAIAFFLLI